ncbi:MAG: peptidase domain-containing ABC transporter, partial [Verrucomicrobiota bacterium]
MGRKVSLAALRLACGTSPAGTTALGLLDGGRLAGLSGKGYRLEAGEIGQVPVPAVLHVRTAEDVPHYVVLLGVEPNGGLRLMDPARGALARCSREEFVKRFLGVALVFAPAEDGAVAAGVRPGRSPWRRLLGLLRPHRRLVLQSFVGAVMMTILGLATAFFVEQLIDRVLPQGDRRLLMLLGFGMVAVLLVRAAMGWLQGRLALRLAEEVDASLVAGYYRHLMRLPQSFFQSMRVGEMVARVGDAVMVREFLTSTLVGLILNPLVIIFSLGVLFLYSWKLAVLALAMLPVFGLLQWLNHQLQGRHQRTLFERGAELEAQMVSSLQGRTLIRDNGLEGDTTLEQENHLVRLLRGVWGAGKSQLAVGTAGLLLTQGFILALLWWGGLLALRGEITPGELMSAFALAGYLAGPMSTLLGLGVNVQEALVGTERLYEILDLEAERDTGTAVLTRELASRDLRLEGVSVRPPGAGPILRQVSAVFPAGRVTALAGPSGCGKSTILG